MPADLLNYQWELGGLVFGYGCPVDHEPEVTPPSYAVRDEDQVNANRDGSTPGTDLFEPGSWQLKLFVNCTSEATALQALNDFSLVWRGDAYRDQPGAATGLRYRVANRTRVVYGRPRAIDAPLGPAYLSGTMPITASFRALSELFFDDYEDNQPVTFREPIAGGFLVPFDVPILTDTVAVTNGPFSFSVGGALPTPSMIDFTGPLLAPGLLIDDKPYIAFQKDIPAGVTYTVDARPWVTSVSRSDGAGVAGSLSPRSRMPKMLLTPGTHTATLLGSTPDGTGHASIRWRNAYPSL